MIYHKLSRPASASAIGLGSAHMARRKKKLPASFEPPRPGINFLDNCWDYSDGKCESGWATRCATAIAEVSCDQVRRPQ
jgi:hypothetical protein